jgi:hypothetical protein
MLVIGFGYAWWHASHFLPAAALMPLSVAAAGTVLGAVQLLQELRGRGGRAGEDDEAEGQETSGAGRRAAGYLGAIVGFVALVWLVGLPPATAVWILAFLRLAGRMRWPFAVLYAAIAAAAVGALSTVLGVHLPAGVLPLLLR